MTEDWICPNCGASISRGNIVDHVYKCYPSQNEEKARKDWGNYLWTCHRCGGQTTRRHAKEHLKHCNGIHKQIVFVFHPEQLEITVPNLSFGFYDGDLDYIRDRLEDVLNDVFSLRE